MLDQVTRLHDPAYYVRKVKDSNAGRQVLSADIDFSISENPAFRLYFVPSGEGELHAEVVDTKALSFDSKVMVKLGGVASATP